MGTPTCISTTLAFTMQHWNGLTMPIASVPVSGNPQHLNRYTYVLNYLLWYRLSESCQEGGGLRLLSWRFPAGVCYGVFMKWVNCGVMSEQGSVLMWLRF